MDRLKFTVTNNSGADIKLPIQFVKTGTFGVHCMCPMIRDAETGEPIGVQVQLSKNWHEPNTDKSSPFYAARNEPKRIWSGFWFHGYTVLEIPAGRLDVSFPKIENSFLLILCIIVEAVNAAKPFFFSLTHFVKEDREENLARS